MSLVPTTDDTLTMFAYAVMHFFNCNPFNNLHKYLRLNYLHTDNCSNMFIRSQVLIDVVPI